MRVWSLRGSQIAIRRLPHACSALSYDSKGTLLAVGMGSGAAALVDAQSTSIQTLCSWQHGTSVRASVSLCSEWCIHIDVLVLYLGNHSSTILAEWNSGTGFCRGKYFRICSSRCWSEGRPPFCLSRAGRSFSVSRF